MKFLHKDELELVSKKLTFSHDYSRFRSVCKSWRSAAPKRPQFPWVIARDRTDYRERTRFFKFYQFSFETNKFLQIPELSELSLSSLSSSSSSSSSSTVDCIGYSHGWMALFNRSSLSVSLFNPLTNSTIDLPVLEILKAYDSDWEEDGPYYSYCDEDDPFINFYLTSDPGASSSDCFALICLETPRILLYCKVGCTDWIEIGDTKFCKLSSIHICCYRGKIFITSAFGSVFVCDFGSNPIVQKIVSCSGEDALLIVDSNLVESDGDLLVVYRFFGYRKEIYFKIFKLEFDGEMAKLVLLKSLDDKSLFFSPRTISSPTARPIFSLTASKYPGCKCNSIYSIYLGPSDDTTKRKYERGTLVLNIYDFEKGSEVVVKDNNVPLYADWARCGWFTPSLLK